MLISEAFVTVIMATCTAAIALPQDISGQQANATCAVKKRIDPDCVCDTSNFLGKLHCHHYFLPSCKQCNIPCKKCKEYNIGYLSSDEFICKQKFQFDDNFSM